MSTDLQLNYSIQQFYCSHETTEGTKLKLNLLGHLDEWMNPLEPGPGAVICIFLCFSQTIYARKNAFLPVQIFCLKHRSILFSEQHKIPAHLEKTDGQLNLRGWGGLFEISLCPPSINLVEDYWDKLCIAQASDPIISNKGLNLFYFLMHFGTAI